MKHLHERYLLAQHIADTTPPRQYRPSGWAVLAAGLIVLAFWWVAG